MKDVLTDIMIEVMKEKYKNSLNTTFALKYISSDDLTYIDKDVKTVICGFDILGINSNKELYDLIDSIRDFISQRASTELDFEHIKVRFLRTMNNWDHDTICNATIIFVYEE